MCPVTSHGQACPAGARLGRLAPCSSRLCSASRIIRQGVPCTGSPEQGAKEAVDLEFGHVVLQQKSAGTFTGCRIKGTEMLEPFCYAVGRFDTRINFLNIVLTDYFNYCRKAYC